MISYDPDKTPELDPEAFEKANEMRLHAVQIICDEPGAKPGDPAGVSFVAFGPFIPRDGERIQLEDGKVCQVKHVTYKLSRYRGSKLLMLVPNVCAVRIA